MFSHNYAIDCISASDNVSAEKSLPLIKKVFI